MTAKVRVGMIGTGFMARTHSECLRDDPRVELAWVASRTEEGARAFAERFGYARAAADWRDLVATPDVDVVDVTAPNALHADMAVAAARAGKHVIVEKPVATTVFDADRVVAAVDEANVLGLYAENRRFAPILVEARARIEAGAIGTPRLVRINELGSGPSHAAWFQDPQAAGGGALIDLGVHGLFVLEWLTSDAVTSVSAVAAFREGSLLDESTSASFCFASGALGQTVSSWIAKGGIDLRTEVFGTEGTMLLDQSKEIHGIHMYREQADASDGSAPHAAATSGWSYPPVDALRARGSEPMLRHFVDCLADGATPLCTVRDGFRVMTLVEAIYRSAREGRSVEVAGVERGPAA